MNKTRPFIAWTIAALFCVSTLFNLFFALQQIMLYRHMQDLAGPLAEGPQLANFAQNIRNDLVAYARDKQPLLIPVLQRYGIVVPARQP